ncbi:MAG: hypothetical protein WC011_01115 [Candidatus Paceibacterota bacterium]
MNNLVINFKKTNKTIDSFVESFAKNIPISIEIINFENMGNSSLEDTENKEIFIKEVKVIDEETFKITFLTLFKKHGMIPGLYSVEIQKKELLTQMQFWATFVS